MAIDATMPRCHDATMPRIFIDRARAGDRRCGTKDCRRPRVAARQRDLKGARLQFALRFDFPFFTHYQIKRAAIFPRHTYQINPDTGI